MPITTKKPPKTEEEFLSGAKGEQQAEQKTFVRDKTFLLRIPAELHRLAVDKARDERVSLHQFILDAMAEKIGKR